MSKIISSLASNPMRIKIGLKLNPDITKFILQFFVLISIFYLLSIRFEPFIPFFNMNATARVLSSVLNLAGVHLTLKVNILTLDGFSIQVVRQCTGIFEMMTISAVILAYPTSKEKKLTGIILALPTIYFLNMFRLVLLSLLGLHYRFLFNAVHEYLFQVTFVFLVVFFWIIWLKKVVEREAVKSESKEKDGRK